MPIPIPIEVATIAGAHIHRVRAQEAQRDGIIVALFHVGQVGLAVGDVAGIAGAFAVDAVVGRAVRHAGGAFGLAAVGVGFDVGAADVVGVVVGDRGGAAVEWAAALGDELVAQMQVVDALVVFGVFEV